MATQSCSGPGIGGERIRMIEALLPDDTTIGAMPHGTVYRLHLAATANYRAGVVCLRTPETSLEVWSHVRFLKIHRSPHSTHMELHGRGPLQRAQVPRRRGPCSRRSIRWTGRPRSPLQVERRLHMGDDRRGQLMVGCPAGEDAPGRLPASCSTGMKVPVPSGSRAKRRIPDRKTHFCSLSKLTAPAGP